MISLYSNIKTKAYNIIKRRNVWGFILAGSTTTILDVLLTSLLVYYNFFGPLISRIISLSICFVINWLMNRQITFEMQTKPTIKELLKFISSASFAMGINYLIYAIIIILIPFTSSYPALAILPAVMISLVFSYLLMKKLVFIKKDNEL